MCHFSKQHAVTALLTTLNFLQRLLTSSSRLGSPQEFGVSLLAASLPGENFQSSSTCNSGVMSIGHGTHAKALLSNSCHHDPCLLTSCQNIPLRSLPYLMLMAAESSCGKVCRCQHLSFSCNQHFPARPAQHSMGAVACAPRRRAPRPQHCGPAACRAPLQHGMNSCCVPAGYYLQLAYCFPTEKLIGFGRGQFALPQYLRSNINQEINPSRPTFFQQSTGGHACDCKAP